MVELCRLNNLLVLGFQLFEIRREKYVDRGRYDLGNASDHISLDHLLVKCYLLLLELAIDGRLDVQLSGCNLDISRFNYLLQPLELVCIVADHKRVSD